MPLICVQIQTPAICLKLYSIAHCKYHYKQVAGSLKRKMIYISNKVDLKPRYIYIRLLRHPKKVNMGVYL